SFCMENIDALRINFSPEQLTLLNFCLGFLMFGVALDIKVRDFKQLFINPRPPVIGLISQLILLPILTLGLTFVLNVQPSIALGMILIAACPGGNVSNFAVHLSKGNTALSVLMTSVSTLMAIFMTPLLFGLLTQFVPNTSDLGQSISVDPVEMIQTILKLVVLPLSIGMSINHFYPKLTEKIQSPTKILSIIIFFGIVFFGIKGNWDNILNYLDDVFMIVLVHNSLAFLLGFSWAKLNKMSLANTKAITIETGIQNSGLALIIALNFFSDLGGMALVAAWWGIWHLLSGFAVAMWLNRK
ncbi:MAG: bile acid:sodium symporter family protein, partial [Bacteroidota bacterium]